MRDDFATSNLLACASRVRQQRNGLHAHDHAVFFDESYEHGRRAIIPFLKTGIDRGEKCIYLAHSHGAEQIERRLKEEGVDAETVKAAGQLVILQASETYLSCGRFNPKRMIELWVSEVERAICEGYPGVRVTGETGWLAEYPQGHHLFAEYEAELNRSLFTRYPVLAICQYDQATIDLLTVRQAISSHPLVIKETRPYRNPYYTPLPPLTPDALPPLIPDAAGHVRYCLETLKQGFREQKRLHFLTSLLDSSPLPFCVTHEDGRLATCNRAFCDLTGYTREQLCEINAESLISPEWQKTHMGLHEMIKSCELPCRFDMEYVRKDGSTVSVEILLHQIRDPDGGLKYCAFINDISRRKQVERELKASEENYRAIFEAATDGIAIYDGETGGIVDVNRRWCDMFGCTPEEARNRRVGDFSVDEVYTQEEALARIRMLEEEDPQLFEWMVRDVNGRYFWVEIHLTRALIGGKKRVIAILRDITQRKGLEKEFLRTSKLEATGILAGRIAHDFNNILTVIMGNASLARMKVDDRNKVLRKLAEIEKAVHQAKELAQRLLTFARGEQPMKKLVNTKRLLMDQVRFSLSGSRVSHKFSIARDLWSVEADEGQISQAINNIVINAVQAMPDGGTLFVGAENVMVTPGKEYDFVPLSPGRYVRIMIRDCGCGIPAHDLPRIFDPYFTTNPNGSGLGLTTCYSIVKRHNGYIDVESKPGSGTTFYVYLPASERFLPPSARRMSGSGRRAAKERTCGAETVRSEAKALPIRNGSILVMDDEDAIRTILKEMLARHGYKVALARDGSEAVGRYKKAKESGRPFDLVIMDLTVPGGMSGKEAMQRIREIDPQAKVIVSSGYSNDPLMSNFREYGFEGYLPKPYNESDLINVLAQVLRNGKPAAERAGNGPRNRLR